MAGKEVFHSANRRGKENSIAYRLRNCYDELVGTLKVLFANGHTEAADR
jgi:hypothetical protein